MKKARIMLVSVAIAAVFSGASAFTAKEKSGSTIYRALAAGELACITVTGFTLVNNGSSTRFTSYFTTQRCAAVTSLRIAYSQF